MVLNTEGTGRPIISDYNPGFIGLEFPGRTHPNAENIVGTYLEPNLCICAKKINEIFTAGIACAIAGHPVILSVNCLGAK